MYAHCSRGQVSSSGCGSSLSFASPFPFHPFAPRRSSPEQADLQRNWRVDDRQITRKRRNCGSNEFFLPFPLPSLVDYTWDFSHFSPSTRSTRGRNLRISPIKDANLSVKGEEKGEDFYVAYLLLTHVSYNVCLHPPYKHIRPGELFDGNNVCARGSDF